ncbi:MAG: hexitol phosphatase HxpB [Chitinophagaceae bacterium]
MPVNTVIFDMDGLLIDSEPHWQEAANETLQLFNKKLTTELYATTTGLRTKEFVHYWFRYFKIPAEEYAAAEKKITELVTEKIKKKPAVMPAVPYIINFFRERNFKIGIASSSPASIIEMVMQLCNITEFIHVYVSAEELQYGKPHPQVYLECAEQLDVDTSACICFEDSFNGMIAVKAARMKCVIVPSLAAIRDPRWAAADLKIASLQNFNELHLNMF